MLRHSPKKERHASKINGLPGLREPVHGLLRHPKVLRLIEAVECQGAGESSLLSQPRRAGSRVRATHTGGLACSGAIRLAKVVERAGAGFLIATRRPWLEMSLRTGGMGDSLWSKLRLKFRTRDSEDFVFSLFSQVPPPPQTSTERQTAQGKCVHLSSSAKPSFRRHLGAKPELVTQTAGCSLEAACCLEALSPLPQLSTIYSPTPALFPRRSPLPPSQWTAASSRARCVAAPLRRHSKRD